MLRRLKIGGRVNLLIAVPLLALITFAAVGYVALQRVSVRGDEYKALKLAQDLRADTVPPPANLLEAWAEVNNIGVIVASQGFTADATTAIDRHFQAIARARADFETSMAYWADQDLDQRVEIRLVELGGDVGVKFFQAIDTELKPAVASGDAAAVLATIQSLEWRYDVQQTGVQRALTWAEGEVITREQKTDDYVAKALVIGGGLTIVLLLLTLLLAVRVRRSIVRPIRALATQAKSVATHDLPELVQNVQDLPADSPAVHLPPFEVSTRDELAELGASFNSVQDAAVDLAAEQAMARRIVSENLVNIARRNQNLLGRTLGFISSLEQGERDPEALDNLFRLDHLTTRMRRNAQSLLVLAGAEPTRLWAPAVPVGDVVRAALSEVENYGQVELADLGDMGVQGAVAGEVAHLLAELLENATSFSPPNSPVTVVGRAVPDGHQLAIFDYGLGMTPEELADANRRLNQVASFDRESNKMLGFQVVARLAARHEIKVMLTTTPGGTGVTAIVRLPKSILETVGAPGTAAPVADFSAASEKLSTPLPVAHVAPTTSLLAEPLPTEMTDEALWASMDDADHAALDRFDAPSAPFAPGAPAAPAAEAPIVLPSAPPALHINPVPPVVMPSIESLGSPVPAAAPSPAAGTAPAGHEPITTAAGLTKRIRGAQLPDLGTSTSEITAVRPADEVRTTLTNLQRGVDLGRSHGADE